MSSRNKRATRILAALCLAACAAFPATAQDLEVAISPSPVGSGARAAGMADAFVAIADDATAASWNPAGLVQLERPEISLVWSWNAISEEFFANDIPGLGSRHGGDNLDINYLSAVWPLPIMIAERNITVSLSYQRKYDFSRNFDTSFVRPTITSRGAAINQHTQFKFEQEGGLGTITPALAFELTPRISLGVAWNLWRDSFIEDNGWTQKTRSSVLAVAGGDIFSSFSYTRDEYKDFKGENFVFGALWNPTDKLSLALRYDTAFTGDVDFKRLSWRADGSLGLPLALFPPPRFTTPVTMLKEERHMRLPDTWAYGAAYRFSDRFWMALDVTRTDWNEFWIEEASGTRKSLIDASIVNGFLPRDDFDTTTTVRLGAEYVFLPKEPEETLPRLWTLRGGLFWDQEPANGKPDDFYGGAIGLGLLVNQRVNIDAAYQLRYGDDVNSDFFRGIPGFREDVLQHRFLLSTVIYF